MSIIISVMSLPSALGTISFPNTNDNDITSSFSFIMAIATLFIMIGKFLLGPPTDMIGGEKTLLLSCATIAILVYSCSIVTNAKLFGLLWILLNFSFSSSWGAVGSCIRENYHESKWGTQLSVIAAGSRLGSMFSSLFYGKVLEYGKDWRLIFKAASLVQVIALILSLLIRNTFKNNIKNNNDNDKININNNDNESMKDVISRVTKNKQFWLMLTGKVSLMVVGQFISFIPLFLITGLGMPNHNAASASSVFSFGSLIASVLGARIYQKLLPKRQLSLVLTVNMISTVLGFFLSIQTISGLQVPLIYSLSSLFIWGNYHFNC